MNNLDLLEEKAGEAKSSRRRRRLQNQLNLSDEESPGIFCFEVSYITDEEEGFSKKVIKAIDKKYENEEGKKKNEREKQEYFGYNIEPFSMKNDRELGKINKEGFFEFERKKNDPEESDAWLDSIENDEKAIQQPIAKSKNIFEKKEIPLSEKEIFHLKKELYDILKPGENANHALNRLRPQNQIKGAKKKNVRKIVKNEENSEQVNALAAPTDDTKENGNKLKSANQETPSEEDKKKSFDRVIEICDALLGTGYPEVYFDTKEAIKEKFIKEEDKIIRSDLDELEKDLEDLNPDHNVVEE